MGEALGPGQGLPAFRGGAGIFRGLLGKAAAVDIFDNSLDTPSGAPAPQLVMRMRGARIVAPDMPTLLTQTPDWARPVVAAALRTNSQRRA